MSLSLYGVPDGQQKGQSVWPCPSVYSPTTALGSLSSVALSSAPALVTLAQSRKQDTDYRHFCTLIWSGFLNEATNAISSGFLREAIGEARQADRTWTRFELLKITRWAERRLPVRGRAMIVASLSSRAHQFLSTPSLRHHARGGRGESG